MTSRLEPTMGSLFFAVGNQQAIAKGIETDQEIARSAMLKRVWDQRFGLVSPELYQRVAALPTARLSGQPEASVAASSSRVMGLG